MPACQVHLTNLRALPGGHAAREVPDVARLCVRRHEVGHVNAAVVVVDHQLREQVVGFDALGGTKPVDVRAGGHAGHLLRRVRLVHPRHRGPLRVGRRLESPFREDGAHLADLDALVADDVAAM